MKDKTLNNIQFEFDGLNYELGFGINGVKDLAKYSIAHKGVFSNVDFFKFALAENSDAGFISEDKVKNILTAMVGGIEVDEGKFTFDELITYVVALFAQAIDTEAKNYPKAEVKINANSTVDVTVDGKVYALKYDTREEVENAIVSDVFDLNSMLELYITGSSIIRSAMQHNKKRLSVNLQDEIFLSIWHAMSDDADILSEIINALRFHANEVVESAIKKSPATIKFKTKK